MAFCRLTEYHNDSIITHNQQLRHNMEILKAFGMVYITISTVCFTLFLIGLVRTLRKAFSAKDSVSNGVKVADRIRLIYVEQVGGAVYMYDKVTDNFLLQAASEEELWTKARAEFPQIQFVTTTKEADFAKDE